LSSYDFRRLSDDDKLHVFWSTLPEDAATDFKAMTKTEQLKVLQDVTRSYRSLVRERCSNELDNLEAAIEARDLYLRARRRLAPRRDRRTFCFHRKGSTR